VYFRLAEKLNGLKDQLRGVEAALAEALSSKHFWHLLHCSSELCSSGMHIIL
jgi:hypothetical protein